MKATITFTKGLYLSRGCDGMVVDLILGTVFKGEPGKPGEDGKPGKSAYQYAQEGGFSGTEEQFTKALSTPVTYESKGKTNEVKI